MAQSAKPISSPVPVAWYPSLAVLMLAVGLVITASFFMARTRGLGSCILAGIILEFQPGLLEGWKL